MEATYSGRIGQRNRLWWAPPRPGSGRTLGDAAHRLRERRALRSRDDPDEAWRCCESWPRTLVHKWNGREFAARFGCPLPELYWSGTARAMPPPESLPEHFVVRTVRGANGHGVRAVTEGRDLLRPASTAAPALRSRVAPPPILIEEFVRCEDGGYRLPPEVKCHVFGDTVGAVEHVERVGLHAHNRRFYTPGWEPFEEQMDYDLPLCELREPPAGFESMLAQAARIGGAVATYIRIDFFVSDRGCVFNEFSTVPGLRGYYTPYAEELFRRLWDEHCPGRI